MDTALDESFPEWLIPPNEGFVAEDLDRLPDLRPHTQLIDGSLVFRSRQTVFHSFVVDLLSGRLRAASPAAFDVVREMTITLGPQQRPEPDAMVIHASAHKSRDENDYKLGDAVLAVEVVSLDSRTRDRQRKPQLYAEAGIKHFWRAEDEDGRVVVYVYELDDVTESYVPTGIYRGTLKVEVPFPVEIDLTEIEDY